MFYTLCTQITLISHILKYNVIYIGKYIFNTILIFRQIFNSNHYNPR